MLKAVTTYTYQYIGHCGIHGVGSKDGTMHHHVDTSIYQVSCDGWCSILNGYCALKDFMFHR